MSESIEDIILANDKRGVAQLRPYLPVDYCTHAARFTLEHPGNVVIATGFYILMSGSAETDGPPGALAIGRALQQLGRNVTYVSDSHAVPPCASWSTGKQRLSSLASTTPTPASPGRPGPWTN